MQTATHRWGDNGAGRGEWEEYAMQGRGVGRGLGAVTELDRTQFRLGCCTNMDSDHDHLAVLACSLTGAAGVH